MNDRLTGYATANVTAVTAEETRALLDLGDRAPSGTARDTRVLDPVPTAAVVMT